MCPSQGTFDSSVFDLPSACTKVHQLVQLRSVSCLRLTAAVAMTCWLQSSPADIVSALPHPRALRELNAIVDVATTTAAASRSPYGM